uniref:Ig-like domain-containing protein n=1 Tax=Fulvivirga sp. TaxID=1931237 RepID=UPI004049C5B1
KSFYVAVKDKARNCFGPRKEVVAEVVELPNVTAGNDIYICDINSGAIDLSLQVAPKGGVFSINTGLNNDNKTFDPFVSGEGEFEFTYTYADAVTGCDGSDVMTVFVGTSSEKAGAGEDLTVCSGAGDVSLSPTAPGGTWTSANSLIRSRINNSTSKITVTGLSPGQYTLTYRRLNSGNCALEESIALNISNPPSVADVSDIYICGNGSGTFMAIDVNDGETVNWYNNVDDSVPIAKGNEYTTPNITTSRAYYVSKSNAEKCESERIEVRANIATPLSVDAGGDLTFCSDNVNYNLSADATVQGGTWTGEGVENNFFVGGIGSGSYELTYTVVDPVTKCSASDTRVVNVGIQPTISLNVEQIKVGEPVKFSTNLNNIVSIKWKFGDGVESEEKTPFHYYYSPGQFVIGLDLVLANGCSGSYTFDDIVTVEGEEIDVVTANGEEVTVNDISAFPNPFSNELRIQLYNSKTDHLNIRIIDASGTIVYESIEQVDANNMILLNNSEIESLRSGLYLLQLQSHEIHKILKIQK